MRISVFGSGLGLIFTLGQEKGIVTAQDVLIANGKKRILKDFDLLRRWSSLIIYRYVTETRHWKEMSTYETHKELQVSTIIKSRIRSDVSFIMMHTCVDNAILLPRAVSTNRTFTEYDPTAHVLELR